MGDENRLILAAAEARKFAYAPYSHFAVGAALQTKDGGIYTGCNIESASYSPTNCAERTALFKAVSEGERRFRRIAIVGGRQGRPPEDECPPCGVCRQALREFCDPAAFLVILASGSGGFRVFTLEQLLPQAFGPENLNG